MKYTIILMLLLSAIFSNAQTNKELRRHVKNLSDSLAITYRITGNLERQYEHLEILLQFNTTMGNYYIRKVDSLTDRIKLLENMPTFPRWQGQGIFVPFDSAHMFLYNIPTRATWQWQ